MANSNTDLHKAKKSKKDEFYTQLSDIERELKHYKNHNINQGNNFKPGSTKPAKVNYIINTILL